MKKKCGICGKQGADILCGKCGRFICESCYDEESDLCVKCAGKQRTSKRYGVKPMLLIGGFGLILSGLMTLTYALMPKDDSYVVLLPFIFGNANAATAVLSIVMFYGLFTASSLLPLYLSMRRSRSFEWSEEIYTLHDQSVSGSGERVQYFITAEVPEKLKDSMVIEDNFDRIVLKSNKDNMFNRTYYLPDGFSVSNIKSEFEENYLLIQVQLKSAN